MKDDTYYKPESGYTAELRQSGLTPFKGLITYVSDPIPVVAGPGENPANNGRYSRVVVTFEYMIEHKSKTLEERVAVLEAKLGMQE